ncbi:MAG: SUMF1/EgtB/PvdO family nonheme iron enzyme, partial [Treponema sp.]|nr:SUMF1/EgtB/PvdO family nonheme iron enzyme [Treponema sp.]
LFTVSFNLNEGIGNATTNDQPVADGRNAIRPAQDPTKGGYEFDDWYDEDDNLFVFAGTPINESITIYAKWLELFTLSFDLNGGIGNETTEDQPVAEGRNADRPTQNPTRHTYEFVNWYDADGILFNFGNTAITEDTVIHAKWMIETVLVEGGSFMYDRNGATGGALREVTTFRIGKYLVTQAQWEEVMGSNPSYFHGGEGREAADGEIQENRPVETVSLYDLYVFANRLSLRDGLEPAYSIGGSKDPDAWGAIPNSRNATWDAATIDPDANGWRRPTKAEWEFAAKGGVKKEGYTGTEADTYTTYAGSADLDAVAWHSGNSEDKTREVGKLEPNELGLYDMTGNLWEAIYFEGQDNRERWRIGGPYSYESTSTAFRVNGNSSYANPHLRGSIDGIRLARP